MDDDQLKQLAKSPDVSSLIMDGLGGKAAALRAMRFSNNPNITEFLAEYDSLNERETERLSWEALIIKAGVDPTAFLGAVMLAIQAYSKNKVVLLAVSNHPDLVQKRIDYAKLPGGHRDRDAIDQALRFLPTSKGSTFIINPLKNGDDDSEEGEQIAAQPEVDDKREEDMDHLFPSLKRIQEKIQPIRLLQAGKEA